jgi:hypothetical protein
MNRLFACAVLLFAASPAIAADANGYTAQFECLAGGPNCNIDVGSLAQQSCQQTITTSTPWSNINWSNDVICIEAGDHTSKGRLTISASGTSAKRKVLRYTRQNDTDDNPWNQSSGNGATISGITLTGSYWIIHRLRIAGASIDIGADNGTGNNNILNRILAEQHNGFIVDNHGGERLTIQNSVIRDTGVVGGGDKPCVGSGAATIFLVNNEIYNCQGDEIILQTSSSELFAGSVIENNDLYITSAYYSDGSGHLTMSGNYACSENGIDIKGGGVSGNPLRIVNNRLWGHRKTDGGCADGSYGESIIFHTTVGGSNEYGLIQNNIIMDGTQAIAVPNYSPRNWSIIGNLIYSFSGVPSGSTYAIDLKNSQSIELYLNTVIDVRKGNSTGWLWLADANHDVKCNVLLNGGTTGGTAGSSTQVDSNGFYSTVLYTANASGTSVNRTVKTRTNSTPYSEGEVIVTAPSSNCAVSSDPACFLYKVVTGGVSAASSTPYCNTLGCITSDGTMQVQAIRGPHAFFRKLRTGPEQHVIPYAKAHISAPEAYSCPPNFGARTGIGINDQP